MTTTAPDTTRHGTVTAYGEGCRCEPCRTARRNYDTERRAIAERGPEPRGPLPTPQTATPTGARRARIAKLEALADQVATALHQERAALARTTRPRAKVPNYIDSRIVRAWARTHGWPNLGTRGRIPADAITAYVTANPGAHR